MSAHAGRSGRPRAVATTILLAAGLVLAVPDTSAAAPPTCGGRPATIVGTPGADTLVGTRGPDVVVGRGGDDVLRGRGGDDLLCGGDGRDELSGGRGDDELYGGRSARETDRGGTYYVGDRLAPGPGNDLVDGGFDRRSLTGDYSTPDTLVYSGATRGVTADLPAGTARGQGRDQIVPTPSWGFVGSAYGDRVTGTDGDDVLSGEGGPDSLVGGAGADALAGDPVDGKGDGADDVLDAGDGDDSAWTRGGKDQLFGGPGRDLVYDGDHQADVLHGGEGDDRMGASGGGRDQLYGDGGDDEIHDVLVPGAGQVVDGGPGANTLGLDTRFVRDGEEQRVTGSTDLRSGVTTVEWSVPTSALVQNARILTVPGRWTVWGTDAPETVNGGYDGRLTAHVGGGDDYLVGTAYRDLLDGGDGTDTALPRKGDDTCVSIEVTDLPGNACN
jgi:Ca2+-binding RTX toxin-like protein